MKNKLSIIVPVYNVEKYIAEAIESLLAQKPFLYEIILVNDGATDSSGAICDQYAEKYPQKVHVIHKENGGLPSARKAGVSAASGQYISFLDGDDMCSEDYYFNMMDAALTYDCDIVCSGMTLIGERGEAGEIRTNAVNGGVYGGEVLTRLKEAALYQPPYFQFGIMPSLCTKIVKAELIKRFIYKVPDGITTAEDASCTFPMLFDSGKVVVLENNCGYYYRQTGSSMSHAYDPQKIRKIITVMDYLETAFMPYYADGGKQIDMFFSHLIKSGINNEMKANQSLKKKEEKLLPLWEKDYVQRALQHSEGVPVLYRLYFSLFREKHFAILSFLIRALRKIRGA